MPEELVRAEDLSKYRQVASHAVSIRPLRTCLALKRPSAHLTYLGLDEIALS